MEIIKVLFASVASAAVVTAGVAVVAAPLARLVRDWLYHKQEPTHDYVTTLR